MKDTSAHNETESEIDQLTGLKKVNKCSLYKLVHRVAFVYNIVVSEVITSCNIQKITILNRCKMYSGEIYIRLHLVTPTQYANNLSVV